MRSLVCVGECMIELNQQGPDAAPGGSTPMVRTYGGDVLNTAVYAARSLNGQCRVAFATALGDDPYSGDMMAAWREEGIDTGAVLRFPGRLPGLYAIRTDADGERSFHYWRDRAAARDLFQHPDSAALTGKLVDADMLYFSGISLAILDEQGRMALLQAAKSVREAGGHVAFDTNYRPRLWPDAGDASAAMEQALRVSTIALPSLEDAAALSLGDDAERIIDRFRALGVEETVVKDGPHPTIVAGPGQPPIPLDQPVVERPLDTTAAGDSFNGAYLARRLLGGPPEQAAQDGRTMAAWVVRHQGAIVPPMPEEAE